MTILFMKIKLCQQFCHRGKGKEERKKTYILRMINDKILDFINMEIMQEMQYRNQIPH